MAEQLRGRSRKLVNWTRRVLGEVIPVRCPSKECRDVIQHESLSNPTLSRAEFVNLLQEVSDSRNLLDARRLHSLLTKAGCDRDIFLGNKLVGMYGKCGSVDDSRTVFDELVQRNVFSWTILIAAYVQNGNLAEARKVFERMPEQGEVTWNTMVAAYAQKGYLQEARRMVHKMPEPSVSSLTVLMAGFVKNGQLHEASSIFQSMHQRDLVSWNAMISAYAQSGHYRQALELFRAMDLKPDNITFLNVLGACSNLGDLTEARHVYAELVEAGLLVSDVALGTAVISMYGKCGSVEEARSVFDRLAERNAVSWNAMTTAYAQNGHLEEARHLFNEMPQRSVASWNAMITVYAQNRHGQEALQLFRMMDLEGTQPNQITFTSVLDACTSIAALAQGKLIQANIADTGARLDVASGTALVNLYAKCASLGDARALFDKMPERNVMSWNTMIAAYAQNTRGKEALQLFTEMASEGIQPSSVTFITVLSTCSHEGLVNDGRCHFASISRDYGLEPTIDHWVCMVDLLGRAGRVAEAEEVIHSMPFEPDATSWTTLLGACKIHNNLDPGVRAAKRAFELESKTAPSYVLLSNIYAEARSQADALQRNPQAPRSELH